MSNFAKFWLDTDALMSAANDCFPLERDLRAKAAELTDPCSEPGCNRISTTECGKCDRCFCERHEHEHDCRLKRQRHCEAANLLQAYERDREQEAVGRDTLAERED